MRARGSGLIAGVVVGLSLGLLPVIANVASAQTDIDAENCSVAILCQSADNESSGGNAHGGNGGNGGFASVHDVANAYTDASSNVAVGDITTGDAFGHNINVDARGGEDPSVIPGSFSDMGEDIVAPGGNAQSGTTGGNGLTADASGGDGGDARGGRGGNIESTQGLAVLAADLIADIAFVSGILP
jgi:hypothetical protein